MKSDDRKIADFELVWSAASRLAFSFLFECYFDQFKLNDYGERVYMCIYFEEFCARCFVGKCFILVFRFIPNG